jgi:hypothetical protein
MVATRCINTSQSVSRTADAMSCSEASGCTIADDDARRAHREAVKRSCEARDPDEISRTG